jgi:hypothetical protein
VNNRPVPINLAVSQLQKRGNQPVSIGGDAYTGRAQGSDGGPESWFLILFMTLLLPK